LEIKITNLEKVYPGGFKALKDINLTIDKGMFGLLGPNGAGKSTLMRILVSLMEYSSGSVTVNGQEIRQHRREVRKMVGYLPQDFRFFAKLRSWEFLDYAARLGGISNKKERQKRIEEMLTSVGLYEFRNRMANKLSGGMKRRALLGQALVTRPDLLLLDEPTNHLDIESIEWLENLLLHLDAALVFVTHDRRFLKNLATRIVEIDRGQLTSWPGDWDNYLRRVAERAHAEQLEHQHFDRKLSQEEAWIRQGIKARRTRNEGRVRALKRMRTERAQRREKTGQVKLEATLAKPSGKKVIQVEGLSFGWDAKPIAQSFSTLILRGDRVGLIGPNGSGKSTLIQLLLGQLEPDTGLIKLGTGLEVAYFDQQRSTLREDWSAAENVAEGREFVTINGKSRHIIGYLQEFLFTPDRARAPITRLSGGERNRLLLAKLFSKASNLLVMDEPTNDLDVETLELLEEQLADYPGTLLLVSHDRDFLDRVVTSTLVLEGEGRISEYVGGYSDWLKQRSRPESRQPAVDPPKVPPGIDEKPDAQPLKLSYKLARELAALPDQVEKMEAAMADFASQMNNPALHAENPARAGSIAEQMAALQAELDLAYARWEELEALQTQATKT